MRQVFNFNVALVNADDNLETITSLFVARNRRGNVDHVWLAKGLS